MNDSDNKHVRELNLAELGSAVLTCCVSSLSTAVGAMRLSLGPRHPLTDYARFAPLLMACGLPYPLAAHIIAAACHLNTAVT